MLFRGISGSSQGAIVSAARSVITAMVDMQYDGTSWGSAEFAAQGSNVFLPVAGWTPIVSTSGVDPGTNNGVAKFLEFGMRDTFGIRAKWYLYETPVQEELDYRVDGGVSTEVDAIITAFQTTAVYIGTITGVHGTMYTYANIGENDYWVHKARRGA